MESDTDQQPRTPLVEVDQVELKKPELSTRVVRGLAIYFEEQFGAEALQRVLSQSGLDPEYLNDEHNWVSLAYLDRLLRATTEYARDPGFAFKAGCFTVSPKVVGVGYSILASISTPRFLYRKLIELSPHYNKVGKFTIVELSRSNLTLLYQPIRDEFMDGELGNDFRIGQFVAWPRLCGLPDAKYEWELIKVTDRPAYRYVFSWEAPPIAIDPIIGSVLGFITGLLLTLMVVHLPTVATISVFTLIGLLVGLQRLNYRRLTQLRDSLNQQQTGLYNYDDRLHSKLAELHDALRENNALNRSLKEKVVLLEHANKELGEGNSRLEVLNSELNLQKSTLENVNIELESKNRELEQAIEIRKKNQVLQDQIQEMYQRQQVKNRFFNHINHELRHPLTFLVPNIEAMLVEPDQTPIKLHRERLETMRDNAYVLLKLINELLELSRIDSKSLRIHYSNADLNVLVQKVLKMVSSTIARHRLVLHVNLAQELPVALVNSDKIELSLINLLSNAFKFTPTGGHILVSTLRGPGTLGIRVADTGHGIPKERLQNLFERFTTVGTQMERGYGSAGLGLSIVKESIETLHNGRVEVESEVGKGTSFTLWIPEGEASVREEFRERRASAEQVPVDRRRDSTHTRNVAEILTNADNIRMADFKTFDNLRDAGGLARVEGRPTILVVDDDPRVVNVVCGLLFREYNLLSAQNRINGEALARAHHPDLILSDVNMNEKDAGFNLCQNLKSDGSTKDIPIILLTADITGGSTGLRQKGADDYVHKPFNSDELKARIELHLERVMARKELLDKNQRLLDLSSKLERMAKVDGLTNVYNRRTLEERGRELFQEAQRKQEPLGCLMMDIDHFRKFNTDYGHTGGDMVLREMGRTLQEWFGPYGMVARYGGEEFTVLLPGFDQEAAWRLADAFRETVASTRFDPTYQFRITISMGVAAWPEQPVGTHESLFQTADDALYRAKDTRNRVCSALLPAQQPVPEATSEAPEKALA